MRIESNTASVNSSCTPVPHLGFTDTNPVWNSFASRHTALMLPALYLPFTLFTAMITLDL